jgi:hypothetical protein
VALDVLVGGTSLGGSRRSALGTTLCATLGATRHAVALDVIVVGLCPRRRALATHTLENRVALTRSILSAHGLTSLFGMCFLDRCD